MAHEAVVIDHKEDIWDAGTTTLIGGVLVPLNEGRGPVCIFSLNSVYLRACVYVYVYTSRWFVICVCVCACKRYWARARLCVCMAQAYMLLFSSLIVFICVLVCMCMCTQVGGM